MARLDYTRKENTFYNSITQKLTTALYYHHHRLDINIIISIIIIDQHHRSASISIDHRSSTSTVSNTNMDYQQQRSLPQTAMEAAHEFAQMLRTGSKILVVTGAGVEYDLGNPNPNHCHRLCALVAAIGGAHVTTNISGVQLLSQPNEQERNLISFVPVRGILYDQQKGRAGSDGCEWRRPRCMSDAHQQPLLQGRRITVPIPVGSVEDEDPNMVAARASAKGKNFLLILGSSLPTNGRALHFLVAADSVERVIFVNIDSSRDGTAIAEALEGWDLPVCAQVTCVAMRGEEFADAVLHFAAKASQPAQLREVVERSKHWVQKEKVDEMRRRFQLPPKSELSVEKHSFGPAKVTAGGN
mmetsp:Transcript_8273/g.8869  ORF Transcript_8273/g.8869 Transcript_8273/m.8869 type:complete len:357 (-) Transcript_8273:24-1094(-)